MGQSTQDIINSFDKRIDFADDPKFQDMLKRNGDAHINGNPLYFIDIPEEGLLLNLLKKEGNFYHVWEADKRVILRTMNK